MEDSLKKRKFKVSTILRWIFYVLAFIIIFLAGMVIYKGYRYPDKIPDIFGYKPMIVLSGSMESEIYRGDLVFVKEVDTSTLKKNDIIAFRSTNDIVSTHRIANIVTEDGKKYFVTKGDNNNSEDDDLVAMEDVEGIYVSRIPKLGSILMFIQRPTGLIIVVLAILFIGISILYIRNLKSENKRLKELEEERREFEEFKKEKEKKKEKNDGKQKE